MREIYKKSVKKIVYSSLAVSTALIPAAAFAQAHPQPEATHAPAGPQPGRLVEPEFCTNVGVKETFIDPNKRQLTPTEVASLPAFLSPFPQARILIETDGGEPLQFSIAPDGEGKAFHTNKQFIPLFVNKYRLVLDTAKKVGARITITHLANNSRQSNLFLNCDKKDQTIPFKTTVDITPPAVPIVKSPEQTATPLPNQREQRPPVSSPTIPVISGHGYLPAGAEINTEEQQFYAEKSFRDLAMEWLTVNYPEAIKTMELSHFAIEFAGTIAIPVWLAMGIRSINQRLRKTKKL
jgi:hypothetical protein